MLWSLIPKDTRDILEETYGAYTQAKAMEKEQHRKTYFDSTSQFANDAHMPYIKLFEQYYNETYE